jgi:exonuclease VII small subunit
MASCKEMSTGKLREAVRALEKIAQDLESRLSISKDAKRRRVEVTAEQGKVDQRQRSFERLRMHLEDLQREVERRLCDLEDSKKTLLVATAKRLAVEADIQSLREELRTAFDPGTQKIADAVEDMLKLRQLITMQLRGCSLHFPDVSVGHAELDARLNAAL